MPFDTFFLALILWNFQASSRAATIGDGTKSLYTGLQVDPSSRGSCLVDGRRHPSETAIPRDHPCHYCICYDSVVSCYWKQCTAAPKDCVVMNFADACNPSLYICKIPDEARPAPRRRLRFGDRINSVRRKRRLTRSLSPQGEGTLLPLGVLEPFEFTAEFVKALDKSLRRQRRDTRRTSDRSCVVLGVKYNLGEVMGIASDVCMECRCAAGKMFCSPKCCFQPSSLNLTAIETALLARTGLAKDSRPPHPLHQNRHQFETKYFLII